jgi:Protein of unknown function (DUF3617)
MRTTVTAWAAAFLGGIACAGTGALAADLPKRKPGLWEVTLTMARGNMPPQLMKFCTDEATDAALYQLGMNAAQGMCSRKDIQRSGAVVTLDSECRMGNTRMTSHAVMTFTGDTAYKTNAQSHFEPPMMGHSESSMTQEAKWVGQCPVDMQPGDMIGPNGMKMNLKSMGQ